MDPVRVLIFSENPDFRSRAQRFLFNFGLDFDDDSGVELTTDPAQDVDVVIVLDPLRVTRTFRCRDGFLWFWQGEANLREDYVGGYDRVFGQRQAVSKFGGTARPPMTDWLVDKTFAELRHGNSPNKTKEVSLVSSRKVHLPGHRLRNKTFDRLEEAFPQLDVFGSTDQNFVRDKWEALAPYKYSIVIENASTEDYITEKLVDCFLADTLPIYFGAPNVNDYYPAGSLIKLPSLEPEAAVAFLRKTLSEDPWQSRRESLAVARERFLYNYSIRGMVERLIDDQRQEIFRAGFSTRRIFGIRSIRMNFDRSSIRPVRDNLLRFRRHVISRFDAKRSRRHGG